MKGMASKGKLNTKQREMERLGASFALQFAPNDDSDFYLEGNYSETNKETFQDTMSVTAGGNVIDAFAPGYQNNWNIFMSILSGNWLVLM